MHLRTPQGPVSGPIGPPPPGSPGCGAPDLRPTPPDRIGTPPAGPSATRGARRSRARHEVFRFFPYICGYGNTAVILRSRPARAAPKILGLRRVPPHAGADRALGAGRTRHAGPHAHRRRQVDHLPAADAGGRGAVHRRDAAHRPHERPGGPPARTPHPGRCDPFGTLGPSDRHRARQLRLRRRAFPLHRARAAGHRGVPAARAAHERASRSGATTSAPPTCASPSCANCCPRGYPCWRSRPRPRLPWRRTSCGS